MKNINISNIVVDHPSKLVGIVTNICEKEKTFTVMYSDGSFNCVPFESVSEYEVIGEPNQLLPILLDTLTKMEKVYNGENR